jgi:hypothetical protein
MACPAGVAEWMTNLDEQHQFSLLLILSTWLSFHPISFPLYIVVTFPLNPIDPLPFSSYSIHRELLPVHIPIIIHQQNHHNQPTKSIGFISALNWINNNFIPEFVFGYYKGHLGNSSSPLNLPRQFTGVCQEFDTLQIPLSLALSSRAKKAKINIWRPIGLCTKDLKKKGKGICKKQK